MGLKGGRVGRGPHRQPMLASSARGETTPDSNSQTSAFGTIARKMIAEAPSAKGSSVPRADSGTCRTSRGPNCGRGGLPALASPGADRPHVEGAIIGQGSCAIKMHAGGAEGKRPVIRHARVDNG